VYLQTMIEKATLNVLFAQSEDKMQNDENIQIARIPNSR
jgi:hypothetical protein